MLKLVSSSFVTLLLVSACAVGPDYKRPSFEVPAAWREAQVETRALQTNRDVAWWSRFDDPVLDRFIEKAIAHNLDIKIAAARVLEFSARHGVAFSEFFPHFGVGAEGTRQFNTPAGGREKMIYDTYTAGVSSQWELDLWGKIRRQNEAARALWLGSVEAERGVRLSIIAAVASGYFNLRSLDQQLVIAQHTAEARKTSYELFKARYEGGMISLLELNQVKSLYEQAQANIPNFQSAVTRQENALAFLLGASPETLFQEGARGKTLYEIHLPEVEANLPSSLLEARPDILAAEQDLIAANATIGATRALYFPSISLTGLLGSASLELSNLFTAPARIWQAAAGLSAPLFMGGQITSQVEVAEAKEQQALFAYQKTVQNAFREANDALTSDARLKEQLAAQRAQIDALTVYANTARLRYDNGYTSYLEVLDAERTLFAAELDDVRTRQQSLQNRVELYKALGGGW